MNRPRLLLIDDSNTALVGYALSLEVEGFEVTRAHGADEGIRLAFELLPDIILSDVVMLRPGARARSRDAVADGGMHLCRKLASDARTARVPVILWTAAPHGGTENAAHLSGAVLLLSKDTPIKELARKIRSALKARA